MPIVHYSGSQDRKLAIERELVPEDILLSPADSGSAIAIEVGKLMDMGLVTDFAMGMSEERMNYSKLLVEVLAGHLGQLAVGIRDYRRVLAVAEAAGTLKHRAG